MTNFGFLRPFIWLAFRAWFEWLLGQIASFSSGSGGQLLTQTCPLAEVKERDFASLYLTRRHAYIYIYISIYLSIYLSLSIALSVCLCLSLSVSVYLCLSLSVSVCLCLSLCLSVSVLSLPLCLSFSLSLSLSLSFSHLVFLYYTRSLTYSLFLSHSFFYIKNTCDNDIGCDTGRTKIYVNNARSRLDKFSLLAQVDHLNHVNSLGGLLAWPKKRQHHQHY